MSARPVMAEILPPCRNKGAAIEHFEIGDEEAKFASLRSLFSGDSAGSVRPGKYVRLLVEGHGLMMSDTDMEWRTNMEFVHRAHGRVLVGGLGIGLVLVPVLAKPEVESVTVIEKYDAVKRLVLPHLAKTPGIEKLRVVVADVLEWKPPKGAKWNVAYFDIWPTICSDNLPDMTRLKRRFAQRLDRSDPERWVGCWREYDARRSR